MTININNFLPTLTGSCWARQGRWPWPVHCLYRLGRRCCWPGNHCMNWTRVPPQHSLVSIIFNVLSTPVSEVWFLDISTSFTSLPRQNESVGLEKCCRGARVQFMRNDNGPYASLPSSHVFEPCPPFWLCYQLWSLRTPSAAFMFNLTPSTDSLRSISLLGWLTTCPEDLAKHARAFLLMAARWASFFLSSRVVSQAYLPLKASSS